MSRDGAKNAHILISNYPLSVMAIAQCTNTLTFYVSPSAQHPPNQPLTSLQLLQVRRCHITSPGTPSPLPPDMVISTAGPPRCALDLRRQVRLVLPLPGFPIPLTLGIEAYQCP